MTITDILSQIKARADAATRGKWTSKLNHKPYKVVWINKRENYCTLELMPEDADFIAAARTDVPRLVKALEICMQGEGREGALYQAVLAILTQPETKP